MERPNVLRSICIDGHVHSRVVVLRFFSGAFGEGRILKRKYICKTCQKDVKQFLARNGLKVNVA